MLYSNNVVHYYTEAIIQKISGKQVYQKYFRIFQKFFGEVQFLGEGLQKVLKTNSFIDAPIWFCLSCISCMSKFLKFVEELFSGTTT